MVLYDTARSDDGGRGEGNSAELIVAAGDNVVELCADHEETWSGVFLGVADVVDQQWDVPYGDGSHRYGESVECDRPLGLLERVAAKRVPDPGDLGEVVGAELEGKCDYDLCVAGDGSVGVEEEGVGSGGVLSGLGGQDIVGGYILALDQQKRHQND